MSTIKAIVDELNLIKEEIRRNNATNKTLRLRSKRLEDEITQYLKQTNQTGVTYRQQGQAILLENYQKHTIKKKTEKQNDMISYLQQLGVSNPGDVYTHIVDLQRGDPVENTRLSFKNLKTRKSNQ